MARRQVDEVRDGVELTHLDAELFDGAGVTKRALVDHLDAVAELILPELRDRPLSVVRVRPGEDPFMQKNLPKHAPDWIDRVEIGTQSGNRTVTYPLCQDRRTLLWLANQRAVEFHPTLVRGAGEVTHLVIDLDPPDGGDLATVVAVARLVRRALDALDLDGAVKTSGAKGLHVVVPAGAGRDGTPPSIEDAAAAQRALATRVAALDPGLATVEYVKADRGGRVFVDSTRAGGASLVAAWSPRARPGVPVSFPVAWDDLDDVVARTPAAWTVATVPPLVASWPAGTDPWRDALPAAQPLPPVLVEEGHAIPVARVAAMHAGLRRRRAERANPPA